MLALSRKIGERVTLTRGDEVVGTIVISRIAGNRVTIGIEAPDDVRIMRGELQPDPQHLQPFVRERLAVNGD